MTNVVFSLNIFEAVLFLFLLVLFVASVVTLLIVLIRKLHIALHTIADLRSEFLVLFSTQTKSLRKTNKQIGDAHKELIKDISKQLNVTIENYR